MKIVNEEISIMASQSKIPYIDSDGNVSYVDGTNKECLSVKYNDGVSLKDKKVSKDYYFIKNISDDHFIVCDVNSSQFLQYEEEYDNSKLSFKYGVIAIQRDKKGKIIPMGEKVVVPVLYDEIDGNNLQTITAKVNGYLTYIDLNPKSENYGKQLVPAILKHAVPFSVPYEGFAECSINDIVGYMPRACEPRTSLNELELLTEEQVKCILPLLEMENNPMYQSSIAKYGELTGKVKTYGTKNRT